MPKRKIDEFAEEREELNDIVMQYAGRDIKRFYNIDTRVYEAGALPAQTKEMLGLVASLVLRCDDCVNYHLIRCREEGVSTKTLEEALAIGLVVGGSIVIPHLRRAFRAWDELEADDDIHTSEVLV